MDHAKWTTPNVPHLGQEVHPVWEVPWWAVTKHAQQWEPCSSQPERGHQEQLVALLENPLKHRMDQ